MAKAIKYIFKCYMASLPSMAANYDKWIGTKYGILNYKKNLNVYFITQQLNEAEITKELEHPNFNEYISEDLKKKIRSVNFKLLNVNEVTFDKDTFEEPEYSYQRMHDTDVKDILFTDKAYEAKEYLKDCKATDSIDFDAARASYHADKSDKKYDAFINDYSITNNGYNSNAYFRLGVKEDKVISSEIVLVCDDLQYFENDVVDVLNSGIYGFLITYKDKSDKSGIVEVPMFLYQYARPTFSNYNKIKLAFNVNGLFGVV